MLKDLKLLSNIMRIYLKGKSFSVILGFITATIFSLIGLATPYLTRFLIDTIFSEHREEFLFPLIMISVVVLIIIALSGVISDYVLIQAFERAKLFMRLDLFKRLLNAPLSFLASQRSGELNYRLIVDVESVETFFSRLLINIPIDTMFVIVTGFIMITWQKELALFVFFVFILQIIVIVGFHKVLLNYALLQKKNSQSLSGFVVERFRNIQLIKTLNIEDLECANFKSNLFELMRINIKTFMIGKISGLSITLVNNIWSFGILWYGGLLVLSDKITLGTLMAFLLVSGMLYPRIASISNAILSFQDVRASLYRYMQYYEIKSLISDKTDACELNINNGEIIFKNVKFGYTPEHIILKEINARFKPNTVTAIVGSSGAGKSTLARMIMRLYDPREGQIYIDGINIKDVTIKSLRKNIGYALQGEFLFSGSIWENICYGIDSPLEIDVINATKNASAYEFIMNLPEKFQTQVGEGGLILSSGEAQRIALARLFLNKFKIIILDEPTSFVDNNTEASIQNVIISAKENSTVIIIAHRLSSVKIADNILVVDNGRIVEEGKHEELLSNNGRYARLYNEKVEDLNDCITSKNLLASSAIS